MIDWSDGSYERTAQNLALAAERALDALGEIAGQRLLDLGCGTGNVALSAARRGARVVAVDPAIRLVDVTRARALEAGLDVEALVADAGAVPAPDGAFDLAASVFAVIFAPDPEVAAGELLRVVRPGGRIVLTTWRPSGAVFEAGTILRNAVPAPPSAPARPAPDWGDGAFVRALFEPRGASVTEEDAEMTFTADSPEAWFDEQEAHHPVWRAVRGWLDAGAWSDVRARSVAVLRAQNEDPSGFRVTSRYAVVLVRRGA